MKTQLILAAVLTGALSTSVLAQTPPPGTDRSGGPTATAGSSAQSNAPGPASGASMTAKTPAHHKAPAKTKPAGDAATTAQPNGTGGTTTPSGH